MTAQLYNFRGHFQLVDVPEQAPTRRRPATLSTTLPVGRPTARIPQELLPYVNEDREVTLLGSRARVAAELARLRATGMLLYASAPAPMPERGDPRVYVDVKLREYPWAPQTPPVAPAAPAGRRRRRAALIAAAVVAVAAVLLGLGYAVSAALREVWSLLVSLAPVWGGLAVLLVLVWLFRPGGGRGCPGAHCPGGH